MRTAESVFKKVVQFTSRSVGLQTQQPINENRFLPVTRERLSRSGLAKHRAGP